MVVFTIAVLTYLPAYFVSRHNLVLKAAALRQQLVVFNANKRDHRCTAWIVCFWVALRHLWPDWANALMLVKPDTVVGWHRAGFRLLWRLRSRARPLGLPKASDEVRQPIRRMRADNPSWGASRIHGELLQLGFDVSEPTVSRYLRKLKQPGNGDEARRWFGFSPQSSGGAGRVRLLHSSYVKASAFSTASL